MPPTGGCPSSLRLSIDFSTKAGPFTVGVRRLVADVTLIRTPREKGYTIRYRQEPEWRLPFLVKPLLRSSLSYPFEGPGSSSSFGVREVHGRTHAARPRLRLPGPGELGRQVDGWPRQLRDEDFRKGAESESDRYSRDCLYALRDDLVTLLTSELAGRSRGRRAASARRPGNRRSPGAGWPTTAVLR